MVADAVLQNVWLKRFSRFNNSDFQWLEVLGVWSLDSATRVTSAYPAHASGSSETRGAQ
jgi:hypothetical protein